MTNKEKNYKDFFKFFIPSLIGILLFMTPIKFNGEFTIPIAIMSKQVTKYLANLLPLIMTILALLSALITLLYKIKPYEIIEKNDFLKSLFTVSPLWFTLRLFGGIFALLTYLKIGPEFIYSPNTGGLLLFDLLPILFAVFLFAGLLLPLILDFGLLEFFWKYFK